MSEKIKLNFTIPEHLSGQRLDAALAIQLPQYSRSRLQQWLKNGQLLVDGQSLVAKHKVQGGENIDIDAELAIETAWQAQAIPLDIVFEDDSLLVINKPINFVVHPAAGQPQNTLANALLHHCPALAQLSRSGIIHRIDKDTSGLLVIAKTLSAQRYLSQQLQQKHIQRQYEAIVQGHLTGGGTIETAMGRHPRQRTKMAVVDDGKTAITHYRIIKRLPFHTHIKVILETGRTHQIRVHMAHIHHPIVGDQSYGGRLKLPKGASQVIINALRQFKRQALHANQLSFIHPDSQQLVSFEANLPVDLQQLLEQLQ